MSIEKMEEIKENYINNPVYHGSYEIGCFMISTIEMFKEQSDMIADLRKHISETEIDYESIKIGGTD